MFEIILRVEFLKKKFSQFEILYKKIFACRNLGNLEASLCLK